MKNTSSIVLILFIFLIQSIFGQNYIAGFKTLQLKDSARTYKSETKTTESLHYRPVDLDIWYPSKEKNGKPMLFRDLFSLFEHRAVAYQGNDDFSGMTEELAQFYVAELEVGTDGKKLLNIKTNTYLNLKPIETKLPVVIYMAGFNGMGFENYKILETLAQNGYVVISVWSVGRYPGNMTNQMADMMEQVYDAKFAINYLTNKNILNANFDNVGLIGCSWGGMSSAVLAKNNPKIKAFVSLDGTETHYFGENEEDDDFIQEIHDSNVLLPTVQNLDYLYLESGDKLDEFTTEKEFHYFKQLETPKHYLRFTNSQHADFTCIPSILKSTSNAIKIHDDIQSLTLSYLNKSLKQQSGFDTLWKEISSLNYTTIQPFDIKKTSVTTAEFAGLILDKRTNEPLPYVNIGILNREIGTVSNSNGKFSLELKEEYNKDTIRISSIGFKPVEVLIRKIIQRKEPVVYKLEEDLSELNEVVITAKSFKKRTLGNKTESKFISTGFSYDQLGAEMGVKINIRKNPTIVDAFNFNIPYNRLSAKSVFRLNFYSINKSKPDVNLLKDNILVTIESKQTGNVTIDLKPYDIVLTDDVITTLEWVETKGENNKGEAIFFSLGILNSGTLYKKSSQAKFRKHSSMGVGFNIDVRY
ncbi:carboxypeptidase-like regulatory domain-containing protein [uncultured Maribacter sp.]|uniref:carboxypeptidase-like regulatory domain-containing protein n=1 Tax=uncultured Maribacter sp. TaxID=431308 RepID=UPI00260DF845|nr:carboxypeptidase-like regulatory domain-containing protein [uncultured Maribacter sp.]